MSSPGFVARLAMLALLMSTVGASAQTGSGGTPTPPSTSGSSSQSQSSANSASAPAPEGFFPEPELLSKAVDFVMDKAGDGTTRKSGFYPEFSNMITGAGWVSVGPGYRQYSRDEHVMFDASAALSWRLYKMGQARVEFLDLARDRLTLGVQTMWQDQTQVNFFGIGPDVSEDDQTQYRMQSIDLVGYGSYRASDWLAFDGTLGLLPSPKVMPPGGTFQGDFPDTLAVFPTIPAARLSDQPTFLHGMLAVRSDTRDHSGHPTKGWYYRAALTNYTDWTSGEFSFNQWEAEATQLVPMLDRRWVLAFRGWIVSADPPAGNEIPFYLLPTIGGHNTLRDFHNMEFHDNAALVVNAESRWAIFTHMDGALFFDAGNVAPTVDGLNLDKVSYGAGVRVHIERTTIARLDVATGPEGWRVVVRTNDPLRLTRGKRRVAAIPFTP